MSEPALSRLLRRAVPDKTLGVQRATTCRYSDCDLPIVACAFFSVAMASDCERCNNYKPCPEVEKR